jgi:hypothetical protein
LFGGHVSYGSDGAARAGKEFRRKSFTGGVGGTGDFGRIGFELGEAEVENFGVAARSDKNIGGLDVAVKDALGVGGVEGVGDVDADVQKAIEFERRAINEVL